MPSTLPVSMTQGGYGSDYAAIERQRRLAEALQEQSMQQLPTNQMAGGYVVPISPTQGLAKIAQALSGNYAQKQADERTQALQSRAQQDLAGAFQTATGTPEIAAPADDLGGGPARPAMAGDPRKAMQQLVQAGHPLGQQLAFDQLAQALRPPAAPKYHVVGGALVPEPAAPGGQVTPAYTAPEKPVAPKTHVIEGKLYRETPEGVQEVGGPGLTPKPQDKWSEPYDLNGAKVQRNESTGEIRTAVSRAPVTNISNTVNSPSKVFENEAQIRKEFTSLPEVKNYKAVLPIIQSVKTAPDTPAGDLDLIYAVGKVLDPDSVVREGEMTLVIKSGSPLQRFEGAVNYIMRGKGRLAQGQRQELLNMMNGRVQALEQNYNAARATYEPMVTRSGLNPANVFTELNQRRAGDRENILNRADAIVGGGGGNR